MSAPIFAIDTYIWLSKSFVAKNFDCCLKYALSICKSKKPIVLLSVTTKASHCVMNRGYLIKMFHKNDLCP